MSDLSYDIQSLLNAPTATDILLKNQQVEQNNNILQQQKVATATAQRLATAGSNALNLYLNSDLNDPKRMQYYQAAMALNPALQQGIQAGYKDMNDIQQKQHLNDASALMGYIQSGDWDNANSLLQQSIDADTKAGADTSADTRMQGLINAAKSGDKNAANTALNLSQLYTASIMGPDKFGQAYPELVKLPTDVAKTQSEIANNQASANEANARTTQLIPAQAAQAQAAANKDAAGQLQVNTVTGDLYNNNPNAPQPQGTFEQSQTQQSIANGFAATQSTEYPSGAPSNIKNPNSSALGPSQAINSTWLNTVKKDFPELAKGKSDAQILAMRTDPATANKVGQEIYSQGVNSLQAQGLPTNYTTGALAYKLGPQGAANVLKAAQGNPNQPLSNILPANVIAANPNMKGKTVGDYINSVASDIAAKGNDPSTALTLGNPQGNGEKFLATLPKGTADIVRGIGTYQLKPPVGQSGSMIAKSPIMRAVMQAYPNFNTNGYQIINDLGNANTKTGSQVAALNTYIKHLSELADLFRQRNAASGVVGNAIGNIAAATFNNSGRTNQINNKINALSKVVAGEKAALYGTDSQEDRSQYRKDFDVNNDTSTVFGNIDTNIQAALDRAGSLKSSVENELGAPLDMSKIIQPDTQHQLKIAQMLIQGTREPNRNDIALLQKNPTPQNVAYFDKTFGAGSASKVLGK